MGEKIHERNTKIYKPEIDICPFCGQKLSYRYTISNKVIQFSAGAYIRVKNLGYGCNHCEHNKEIYFSQTAAKFCIKGYTYSSKVIALIYYYKMKHYSREQICDIFFNLGIEISDRNVDLIYNKYAKQFNLDYKKNIIDNYDNMLKKYNQIRISIDSIRIEDIAFISIRNFFTGEQIGLHKFNYEDDFNIKKLLNEYISKELNITYIFTVREMFKVAIIVKELASDDCKIVAFEKH